MLPKAVAVEISSVRSTPDGRLTRADAATYIGVKSKTLAEWSRLGKHLKPIRVGSRIFYLRADLEAFVAIGAREAGHQ